jgi:hypothetical protein
MPDDDLRVNAVWVIESLRQGDLRTGTDLRDAVLVPLQATHKHLKVFFSAPVTKADLFDVLQKVLNECRTKDLSPILHFEVHGGRKGMELTSGEVVSWEELKGVFTDINVATSFNLLVVLAACDGANLVAILRPTDRAPMWGLVGPVSLVSAGDLFRDFSAFYQVLLTHLHGDEAVRALNRSAKGTRWQYAFYSAYYMFGRVYEYYKRTHGAGVELRRREKKIARQVAKSRGQSLRSAANLRKMIAKRLRNHKENFLPFAVRFFMHDLVPSTQHRYPLDSVL